MKTNAILRKMATEYNSPVVYSLNTDNGTVSLNSLIGNKVQLTWDNEIYCLGCGKKTYKSFAQGYCFSCFQNAPETEECVLRPELCQAHLGIARDIEYAKIHCLQNHYVYLAASPEIKVGVTREPQVPFRWIDQGASFAMAIAKTPNRYTAGLIEVELKKHISDKTNWRLMLKGVEADKDQLLSVASKLKEVLNQKFSSYVLENEQITEIVYPVSQYPEKIQSIDFDKIKTFNGKLSGIKGQYLLFDDGQVINIRKYGGYKVSIEY